MTNNYRGFSVNCDRSGERYARFVDLLNWKMDEISHRNIREKPLHQLTIAREIKIIVEVKNAEYIFVEDCGFYMARHRKIEITKKQLQKLRELWVVGKNSAWKCWRSGGRTIFMRPLHIIDHGKK